MAVQEGTDYVFAPNMTYVAGAGIGDGCMIGTKRLLLMIPIEIMAGGGNEIVTRTFTLGGETPVAMIRGMLDAPELTLEDLEQAMRDLDERFAEAVLGDLTDIARLKVKAGFFSRGIYYNKKEAGLGGWTGYPLKKKDAAQAFVTFYADHPKLVAK